MIRLYHNDSGAFLAEVTEAQLRFLIDHLEETDSSDRDYYVDSATLDMLEDEGGDPALMGLLRQALGNREGMEIRWEGGEARA